MLKGQRKTVFALVGCISFLGIPCQSTTSLVTCSCCLVAQSCLTLCDPHGLQHARLPCPSLSPGVNDAIQTSHPLLPTSPPSLNLPQHQGLFQ